MLDPAPLQEGGFYHCYNQGNNREDLFREERNWRYFMQLYARHLVPVADTYAYGLLRNHFHLLVRIKDLKDLTGLSRPVRSQSQAFSNLFNAYARAFNLAYGRSGALFKRPFQRIQITDDDYLVQLIIYIHWNPQKHGLVGDFRSWRYSSYATLASQGATRLRRDEVLALFGGQEAFRAAHEVEADMAQSTAWAIEF